MQLLEDRVYFEAVLQSKTGRSMFAPEEFLEPDNLEEFVAPPGRGIQAATILQSLGFRVQHVGTFSISGDGPRELWEQVFGTQVEQRSQPLNEAHPELGEVSYWSHMARVPFTIPENLADLVERAYPQRPPTFFESPLPPQRFHAQLNLAPN